MSPDEADSERKLNGSCRKATVKDSLAPFRFVSFVSTTGS
jgi:hypothetical protein